MPPLTPQQIDSVMARFMEGRSARRHTIAKIKDNLRTDIVDLDQAINSIAAQAGLPASEQDEILKLVTTRREEVANGQ